jgi:predicted nuclease of predicted toxin-antitoxin system
LKLFTCKLLADENIHPAVVQFLRQEGCDIKDALTIGLRRQPDELILARALRDSRVVLTHDRDFGRLAIPSRQPMYGIVFLRPGHIEPQFTIATLKVIDGQDFDLTASFILVARRRGAHVQMRLRRW